MWERKKEKGGGARNLSSSITAGGSIDHVGLAQPGYKMKLRLTQRNLAWVAVIQLRTERRVREVDNRERVTLR